MKKVKTIILYVLAVYFILQGAFGISYSIGASIMFWLCALFTLPVFHNWIAKLREQKGLKPVKSWIYILLVLLFFIVGWILWPASDSADTSSDNTVSNDTVETENRSSDDIEEVDLTDISAETTNDVNEEIVDDGIIEKLEEFGFTEDEAAEMRKLFIQCGVTNIDGCEPTDPDATIDGIASFRAEWDKDRTFWFTVDHRKIFYMSLNGTDVYDEDQGGFLINVNDVHVPESSMTEAQKEELLDKTENTLDKYFKHTPYYDAWGFARSDDDYMAQCEAYAKNDLGVSKYVTCRVWYTKDGDSYNVTGVSIDGVQYEVK